MPPKLMTRNNSVSSDKEDEGATEQLINKVCIRFLNQIESKFDEKFGKLDEKLNDVSNSLKQINNLVNTNQNSIEILNNKVASLEQQCKRNALRFHGFPVEQDENMPERIVSYINNTLKIPCAMNDIDCAFRVGKRGESEKPPTVLVNFTSNIKRNEVFAVKKLNKNSGIVIFEDLTRDRHKLLMAARKKYGNGQAWTSGGKVYVLQGNKKCALNSEKDL